MTSNISRRSFIAASGMAAMAAAGSAFAEEPGAPAEGAPMGEGGAPGGEGGPGGGGPGGGGPMGAAASTPPYSGPDGVMRTDANGESVYYSMRRNWVGEPPVVDEAQIAQTIEADVVIMGLNYSGSQCFRMACEKRPHGRGRRHPGQGVVQLVRRPAGPL